MNAALAPASPAVTTRFVDNNDGTVTDTRTGLTWSKATLNAKEINHHDAVKLCAELTLAGHTDWRQPTVEELFLLADRTRFDPAIDTEAFPDTKSDWYWSSTIHASGSSCAWIVHFGDGGAGNFHRGYGYGFVRAVRGGGVSPGQ